MAVLGVKSVPLMRETNIAWKTVPGFWFVARERSPDSIVQHINAKDYEAVINLGRVDLPCGAIRSPVFNRAETIRAISTPRALRRTLGDGGFLPDSIHDGIHWHKYRGFGGVGKVRLSSRQEGCGRFDGESQRHVGGDEYRIISVGDRIVQASKKGAVRKKGNGRNDFEYAWVGVDGIRKGGFIPLLKEAVVCMPAWERTVIGWDVIHDGERPWIIEANTSPGVNDATARRIVDAVKAAA